MSYWNARKLDRRTFGKVAVVGVVAAGVGGCGSGDRGTNRPPQKVWGGLGAGRGQFSKPRAMTIDDKDQLYIVDMTARIQVFDVDGTYIRGWQTPEHTNGRPTGLSWDLSEGNLMVADTHYNRVLRYTPTGELLADRTLGGVMGQGPGEFGLLADVIRDSQQNYYTSEYGEWDRIQKFSPDGRFIAQWGGHGEEPGHFMRPQHLEFDGERLLWVADACNHRIQVFDKSGKFLKTWGTQGSEIGQLYYPYCLALDGKGHVYVSEYGNHRVQKFTLDGKPVDSWGSAGRKPGQLNTPWAVVLDSRGRVHVLDSMNHRVQRFEM